MRKWHDAGRDAKLQSDTQRPRLRHLQSASLSGRGQGGGGGEGRGRGEGGRGGVLPKRLKSGSGHHRPEEARGPSNGRHKLSYNAGLTSSPCCVLSPVPLMHLIPSMSPMPYYIEN